MKTIPLTKGYHAIVDDGDYDYLSQYKWYVLTTDKKHFYAARYTPGDKCILMHREILGLPKGRRPLVDHRDRNGLNNTRENLRAATLAQNMGNSPAQNRTRPKSSRYKGVCRARNHDKWLWRADIGVGNKRHRFLGNFKEEEDAARAYNQAAIEIFGEFALINEIPSQPVGQRAI